MSKKLLIVSLLILLLMPACYSFDQFGSAVAPQFEQATPVPFPTLTALPTPQYALKIWLETPLADFTSDEIHRSQTAVDNRLLFAGLSADITIEDDTTIVINTNETSETIVSLVTQVGLLELVDFSEVTNNVPEAGDCVATDVQQNLYPDYEFCPDARLNPDDEAFTTVITSKDMIYVAASISQSGIDDWVVNFILKQESAETFGDFTESHIGEALGIVLDGKVISAPIIQARITSNGVISGNFTLEEASELLTLLQTGALPLPLEVVGIKSYE